MSEPAPTALLIEDEPQIRRFVRAALEEEGWQVFEAATLQRGLADAGTRTPDLIVLDLGLPDGDGLELLDRIQERAKRTGQPVQVVLMTGFSGITRDEARARGASEMLLKPFLIEEHLAVISQQKAV